MSKKGIPITQEQYDLLNTSENWNINEVPRDYWSKIPGVQRIEDTIAIMASGSSSNPQLMNKINNVVAGMDVLVHEIKRKGNEPEGNAYHYVIQKVNNREHPYIMYGPYKTETIVDHWFEADDLDAYWQA